jgi:serine/threonine-protein kinase
LPADQQSLVRAVALTLASATAVSLYVLLLSVTPRTLEPNEALPLAIFEGQRLADGRLATRARFETWPTLWAAAAWAVAFVAYGLLRGHWRRVGLDASTPDQPLVSVRPVVRMAFVLNALFVVHLLLERTTLHSFVIYIPILGGILELGMVYLVWVAVLEALRTARPLRREPWLWLATVVSLIPPAISSLRVLHGSQP